MTTLVFVASLGIARVAHAEPPPPKLDSHSLQSLPTAVPKLDPVKAEQTARKRRGAGIGLLATSSAAWGTSLAMRIGIHMTIRQCERLATDTEGGLGCIAALPSAAGMQLSAWLLDASSIGLAAGGGALLGQGDGLRLAVSGEPLRGHRARVASGVTLLVFGLGTFVASEAIIYGVDTIDTLGEHLGMSMVTQLGVAAASTGAGLLGHARAKRRAGGFRIAPHANRFGGGLALSGSF